MATGWRLTKQPKRTINSHTSLADMQSRTKKRRTNKSELLARIVKNLSHTKDTDNG